MSTTNEKNKSKTKIVCQYLYQFGGAFRTLPSVLTHSTVWPPKLVGFLRRCPSTIPRYLGSSECGSSDRVYFMQKYFSRVHKSVKNFHSLVLCWPPLLAAEDTATPRRNARQYNEQNPAPMSFNQSKTS